MRCYQNGFLIVVCVAKMLILKILLLLEKNSSVFHEKFNLPFCLCLDIGKHLMGERGKLVSSDGFWLLQMKKTYKERNKTSNLKRSCRNLRSVRNFGAR